MAHPALWRRLAALLAVLCLHGFVLPTEQHTAVRYGDPPSILHVEPDIDVARRRPRTLTISTNDDADNETTDPEVAALLERSTFLREELVRVRRDTSSNVKSSSSSSTVQNSTSAATSGTNTSTATKKNTVSTEFSTSPVIAAKTTQLNDSHGQLIVHWLGEGTDIMICLAREPPDTDMKSPPPPPSRIFMSNDYGDTFEDKTKQFMLKINGTMVNSTVEQFFTHHKYNTIVFIDPRNQAIFTSEDYGKTITVRMLDFTPSDVTFYDTDSRTFLVLDKRDPQRKLYYTTDFGASFTLLQSYVKSFLWSSGEGVPIHLYVERKEPTNTSSVIFFNAADLYSGNRQFNVLIEKVEDFHIKKDFMFASQRLPNSTQLLISYKRGKFVKADFQTELDIRGYHVADVEGRRIMISVVHTERISHLYVSESNDDMTDIKFVPSLENVFSYIPDLNWRSSWLVKSSDTAFTDVYRVEGLRGIYIASKMNRVPVAETITPDYLVSVITFDHGNTWRPIKAPDADDEGQPLLNCGKDCSLHLSQKFCSLYPVTRSVTIMSSKSAPGVIMASGVVGKSMKGHPGVYISRDAGMTWKQILKNYHFFNMGDHGGLLVAVKYFKSKGETNEILYSTDEGERWHSTPFIGKQLKVYGLMTEPEANGTIFTLFGSEQEEHRWLIIKIDLKNAFTSNCTEDDYKFWAPGSYSSDLFVPCVLGRQDTYQRRKPHANCHNGIDYERPIRQEVCECNTWDFECDYGFVRSGQKRSSCVRNKTLTSFDPYEVPKSCKPGAYYNRTRGYRKIEGDVCVDGFASQFLPQSIPCPMQQSEEFLIVAQREKISRIDLRNNNSRMEFAIPDLKNVIAIEFDMKRNCVFWADIMTDVIGRLCLNGNFTPETLLDNGLSSVEGMSYDWISEVLYFVDGMRLMIEALRIPPPGTVLTAWDVHRPTHLRRTIIDNKHLNKPRGIVVHPMEGYIFWTDWNSIRPSISRANMDGTDVRELFTKPDVAWPNGVTIDYMAQRLYWVDASKDYIASSDLDGKNFHKVLQADPYVQHPFAVAVMKDVMYWDDWKKNSVFSADKDHGVMVQLIAENMLNSMDMKVYGHTIQAGTNGCAENNCAHMCVGLPKGNHTCLCPDSMELVGQRCNCPAGTTLQSNGCSRGSSKSCGPKLFDCANNLCVPLSYRCDGDNDCEDNSDEEGCPVNKPACPPHMFTCKENRNCIPKYFVCDFDKDCNDGSDEQNCKTPHCKPDEFACDNGHCIKPTWVCDGEDDCRDGSDEKDCRKKNATRVECKADEFRCNATGNCLPNQWRCDTEVDCADGSDERNCTSNKCEQWMFTCVSDGRCIYKTWHCDGEKDCKDGSDEKDCPAVNPGGTSNSTTKDPPTKKPTININPGQSCHDWMFKCNNDRCVPYWWKCDGVNDCEDHSDEQGCGDMEKATNGTAGQQQPGTMVTSTRPPPPTRRKDRMCGLHEFRCNSGSCVSKRFVCDGYQDCPQGEDEQHCQGNKVCNNSNFRCRTDGMCLSMDRLCNGVQDCADGSDEECKFKPTTSSTTNKNCSTNPGVFSCDNTCLALTVLCDRKVDCYDGTDEENCGDYKKERYYQVTQIGVDQRSLNSTSFLIFWWIPLTANLTLEYLPSIYYDNEWKNATNWINGTEYRFTNLKPYTMYKVTTYVRLKGQSKVTPPYIYYEIATTEGTPTDPLNVSVIQQNGSRVLVSWEAPKEVNGRLDGYTVYFQSQSKNVIPAQNVKVGASETSVIIDKDFTPDVVYQFWVKARNGKHESVPSKMVSLKFDGKSFVEKVTNIKVLNQTAKSVTLTWKPVANAEGYIVVPILPQMYPVLPTIKVQNATSVTLDNMVPGTQYVFKVAAYVKNFFGQHETQIVNFEGVPLPALNVVLKEKTDEYALLEWNEPQGIDVSKVIYGVYYGTSMDALFEAARINTTHRSIKLTGLMPCQSYLVSVGIVGPVGPGPLGRNPLKLETAYNRTLPPKDLTVDIIEASQEMTIEWQHSCALDLGVYPAYIVKVRDLILNKTSVVTVQPSANKTLTHVFRHIPKGAAYEVSVSTKLPNAQAVSMIVYSSPLPSPYQLQVWAEVNGTHVVYWKTVSDFKDDGFVYEVIVNEGHGINVSVPPVLTLQAKEPPVFIEPYQLNTISENGVFTVGVRLKTDHGLYSDIVETESFKKHDMQILMQIASSSGVSAWMWIVPTIVAIALLVVVAYGFQRHRRLQTSFSRFANSHYDTRTGATRIGCTMDDDEHEHQVPRSFSDDEPLVIA